MGITRSNQIVNIYKYIFIDKYKIKDATYQVK